MRVSLLDARCFAGILQFFTAFVACLLVACGASSLTAAPPPAPDFECRFTDAPVTVDGKGDDPAWKLAQPIDRFHLPWLGDKNRTARTATRAKLLWDRDYLYFLADMDDADLYADVREQDGATWENDVFELFFKPADDKPGYYEFQVSPAGTKLDMFLPRRGAGGYARFKGDGKFQWETKVELRGTLNQWSDEDQGWTAEGRIPWRDLLRTGGRPDAGERWKFQLCRYDYSVAFEGPELSTCAPTSTLARPDFHHYEDYATLVFVGPQQSAAVKPYGIEKRVEWTESRVVGSPDPPSPYKVRRVYPELKLNFPVGVFRQPGSDRLLVIQQPRSYSPTTIRRFRDEPNVRETELLLEADETAYDITFHPKFAENGYVYVGSNGPFSGPSAAKKTRVTRYKLDPKPPYAFDPKSAREIIAWASDGHNGGALAFGLDGMLYVTSGDGTSDSDTNLTGQGLDHLLAKVLRLDVDHPAAGQEYGVPADNPWTKRAGTRPETWAYGLRNPWRMTVDPQTGHLWVGNNGQDVWEQIYFVRKGDNYGWSVMEGSHPFYLTRTAGPDPFVKPAAEHHHSVARSLTGGVVYYGQRHPELRGAYLYGDYSTGKIWAMKHDGKQVVWHKEIADSTLAITGFGFDSQGELLICDHRGDDQGALYTLDSTPPVATPTPFPRKLSETGLFRQVAGHQMHPAAIPYSVNSPLWSDGAHKERWLAIPGADAKIDMTPSRGWNFPNGTVLVKSFALEDETGDKPADARSRRWIETRLLTRQDNEWVGYSYQWNDQQTDATLVDGAGLDREFPIRTARSAEHPDGVRKQAWHYPSRAECMVCHSRAANYVLGLTTAQMNREHDYHGVRDNQLRVLEHLGFTRSNWATESPAKWRESLAAQGKTDAQIGEALAAPPQAKGQRTPVASSLLAVHPDQYERLADPYDRQEPLERRVRAYLQANCAHCHVEAGGGNAQMNLEWTAKLDKMNVLDVKPLHHTFDIPEPKLIARGEPAKSVLLERVQRRKPGQMPPLATTRPDPQAVELIRQWIESLKP